MARVIVRTTYPNTPRPYVEEMVSTYQSLGEAFAQYYDPFSVPPSAWYPISDYWWLDTNTSGHGWRMMN